MSFVTANDSCSGLGLLGARQLYEYAAELCRGDVVLELYCGAGTGTPALAARARRVLAIDADPAAVDAAMSMLPDLDHVSFAVRDPLRALRDRRLSELDSIVWLRGSDALTWDRRLLRALVRRAEVGVRAVLALSNPVLDGLAADPTLVRPGWELAVQLLAELPEAHLVAQYAASAALLMSHGSLAPETAQIVLRDPHEVAFATAYVIAINFPESAVTAATADIQLAIAPTRSSELRALQRENAALRARNEQLECRLAES